MNEAETRAEAWDKPYTEGVGQAKGYAAKLAVRFAYATNGQKIYGIDMTTGLEGDVAVYPSPDALWSQTFAEADAASALWRDRFAAVPFEDRGGTWQGLRFYITPHCTQCPPVAARPQPACVGCWALLQIW